MTAGMELSPEMQKLLKNLRAQEMEDEPPGSSISADNGIDHLSPTKIDMYARCPMQIEWRYVKGIIAPPQVRLIEGAKYHETAAVRNIALRDKKRPMSAKTMAEFFQDTFREEVSRTGAKTIVWDEENKDMDVVLARSKSLVPILHGNLAPIGVPKAVEQRMEGTIAGVKVVAITDLEDAGGVADYKVVTNKKSQGVADASVQLSVYSYMRRQKKVRLDQLIKSRGGTYERTPSTRGAGDNKWLEQIVARTWRSICAGAFAPCDPTSWVCSPKWCGWYQMCRGACYSTGRKSK